MKQFRLLIMGLMAALAISLAACGGGGGGGGGAPGPGDDPTPVTNTTFEVVQLANLDGGSFSAGIAINLDGMAVGYADDGTTVKGVMWDVTDPTTAVMLEALGGDDALYSASYGINAAGMTVGESETATGIVAVFWNAGATLPTALNLTGLPDGSSAAYAVNGSGEIVGEATNAEGDSLAVYWPDSASAPIILGHLSASGSSFSSAYYISDAGLIVGESRNADGDAQAVVWAPGEGGVFVAGQAPEPLTAILDQSSSVAFGVDLDGRIVGEVELESGVVRGVVWNADGSLRETLPAATSAQFVTNNDRIVGYSNALSGSDSAIVWNTLDTTDSQGLTEAAFSQAYGANDVDQIVGIALSQAVVALPVTQ
ncbi:hypothetical protein [Geoalkalibacter sp.]|uniref:hypothetical protein n=1 Tax=Geoalkalibacter sp. TaxID=3041440 RepID=UPI00272EDFEA|nr:hypothetical protein [Geoalkalibacter sp.]